MTSLQQLGKSGTPLPSFILLKIQNYSRILYVVWLIIFELFYSHTCVCWLIICILFPRSYQQIEPPIQPGRASMIIFICPMSYVRSVRQILSPDSAAIMILYVRGRPPVIRQRQSHTPWFFLGMANGHSLLVNLLKQSQHNYSCIKVSTLISYWTPSCQDKKGLIQ